MTLLCPENSVKRNAAQAYAKTAIREEVHCCQKKLVPNPDQKKGAIAALFQPLTIIFRELLDLRLRKGERLDRYAKTAKQFLKGTIPSHFIDSNRSFLGLRSHNIAIPALEIAINVSEEVASLAKRFPPIRVVQHSVVHCQKKAEEGHSFWKQNCALSSLFLSKTESKRFRERRGEQRQMAQPKRRRP